MIVLSGADVVLPDRVLSPGTVILEGNRIVDVAPGERPADRAATRFDLRHHYVVPGFIDVHVHGVHGTDVMDDIDAVRRVARVLPGHGVTAFCPTTIACPPAALRRTLAAVRDLRTSRQEGGARVLPAHLESNFLNPRFKGAQPLECLRLPGAAAVDGAFSAAEILDEIAAARPDVGIVTVASELDGGLELIRELVAHGHHVSLGHSGATFDEAMAGIDAGARQATHLFNRMTPLGHRDPGLPGAVLTNPDVIAEIICDGVHVHPAMVRLAVAAKGPAAVMAITDGTSGSGLPTGTVASLGGRPITVGDVARLEDGTIAGSVLTMDRAFARLVTAMGLSFVDAATLCATTPARALGLQGFGLISPGAFADLAVLDRDLRVVQTWIGGNLGWRSGSPSAWSPKRREGED